MVPESSTKRPRESAILNDCTNSNKNKSNDNNSNKKLASHGPASASDDDLSLDLSSDIKGILQALQQVRQKAHKDGEKKNREIIDNLAAEIKNKMDAMKQKTEKEWQNLLKTATKTWKEYESALQNECAKYQAVKENFCKGKATHVQACKDILSNVGDQKNKWNAQFEQQRKKDKAEFSELQKSCAEQIAAAEKLLKKNKQADKSFGILRKSLGSFLESSSDDDELLQV